MEVITFADLVQAKILRVVYVLSRQLVTDVRKAVAFLPSELAALESVIARWGHFPDALMGSHIRFLVAASARFNDMQHAPPFITQSRVVGSFGYIVADQSQRGVEAETKYLQWYLIAPSSVPSGLAIAFTYSIRSAAWKRGSISSQRQ